MRFSTVVLAAFAGLAATTPLVERQAFVCSNGLDTPVCCGTDVDGVADLTCESRMSPYSHLFQIQY